MSSNQTNTVAKAAVAGAVGTAGGLVCTGVVVPSLVIPLGGSAATATFSVSVLQIPVIVISGPLIPVVGGAAIGTAIGLAGIYAIGKWLTGNSSYK